MILLPIGIEPITPSLQNRCSTDWAKEALGRGGFEPPTQGVPVFKTGAISHSATYHIITNFDYNRSKKESNLYLEFCRLSQYHYATRPNYYYSGRQDLNLQSFEPKSNALPLCYAKILGLIGLEPTMPKHGFTIRCNNQLCHNPKRWTRWDSNPHIKHAKFAFYR